jgi:hypothetical protein
VDLLTTLRILLDRWRVVVPALLLTLVATLVVGAAVKPVYQATGVVVLLVPARLTDPVTGQTAAVNPYLQFGGSLEVTADALVRVMMSDAAAQRARAAGGTADFEVGTGTSGSSPIVNIVATGRSTKEATGTVRVVARELSHELARRQHGAGAPQPTWIRLASLSSPTTAHRLMGSRLRAEAAVAVLGLALSLGLTFLVEGWSEGRRRDRDVPAAARGLAGGSAGGSAGVPDRSDLQARIPETTRQSRRRGATVSLPGVGQPSTRRPQ